MYLRTSNLRNYGFSSIFSYQSQVFARSFCNEKKRGDDADYAIASLVDQYDRLLELAHSAAGHGRGLFLFGNLGDQGLGREHQRGDRSRVLQRRPRDLRRVDDSGLDQVLELFRFGVEAHGVALLGLDAFDDHRAFVAGVLGDLAQRLFESPLDDVDADLLVFVLELEGVERLRGADQRDAAARHDPLFDRRARGVHGVLDASLLLFQLGLGRGADLDHGDASDQLGQTLLQFLAVVIRSGLFDLAADGGDAPLDVSRLARALDDRRVVLVDGDLLGAAQVFELDVLKLDPQVFADHLAARQDGDVFEHGFATIAEARRLDGADLQRAAQLVDDQRRQSFPLDIFRDDQQRLAQLGHLLEQRQQILHRADLLLVKQNQRVLERRLHALGVGHEIGRQIAAVELHTLDHFEQRVQRLRLLDGDDAVFADLLHRLGDDPADGLIAVGRDRADLGDGVALDRFGLLLNSLDRPLDGFLDAAFQSRRISPGGHGLDPLFENLASQNRRSGRAVAGHVRGLRRHLAHHLRAHVLERLFQLDLLGHGHAVLGDRRRAEFLVDDHVAPFGAERDRDRVGQLIDAAQDRLT